MLQIDKLYNHIDIRNTEDLDTLENIYIYLQITRLLNENVNDTIIENHLELLDEGHFTLFREQNVNISTLEYMLEKLSIDNINLKEDINNELMHFTQNLLDTLDNIHSKKYNDLNNKNLDNKNDSDKNKIIEYKLNSWWSWINNSIIDNLHNDKSPRTIMCNKIIKYINAQRKINIIKENLFKLLISDIINYNDKYINEYSIDTLRDLGMFIHKKQVPNAENLNISFDNIEEICQYLLHNKILYKLHNNTIIIKYIENYNEEFNLLYYSYHLYKKLKIILKQQFDFQQDIILTTDLQNILIELNKNISELIDNIPCDYTQNLLYSEMNLPKELNTNINTKKKYYIFVQHLNKILFNIYDYYMNHIDKNSLCYNCLIYKYNILNNNINKYNEKI